MSATEISPDLVAKRIAELRSLVARKREELGALVEELDWWEAGERFFEQGTAGTNGRQSNQTTLQTDRKPTLRDAIRRIMNERPNATWPAERVITELAKRGWLPGGKNAEHMTRSMLANMKRQGQLERVARGRYRLAPTDEEA